MYNRKTNPTDKRCLFSFLACDVCIKVKSLYIYIYSAVKIKVFAK